MSNENKPKKRKFPEIPNVRATPGETTATQNTVKRMLGRLPLEREGVASKPADPPPPTTSYHPLPPPRQDAAPKKDFARVANSINRDALPAGLFKGTSKKLYDALYQRTRGAIVPVRIIQAKQGDMMEWAGISHNTLRGHLRHLEAVGLIVKKWELGDNDGARYEVFIPEELPPPTTSYHHLLPPPTSDQKLGGGSTQKLVGGGGGQVGVESIVSGDPKTLIKTKEENSDDDAAARRLGAMLIEAEKELTGKVSSSGERWEELGSILVAELKIAAARTTISNVPAFLSEHLRRRLWKVDKTRAAELAKDEGAQLTVDSKQLTDEERRRCPDCAGVGFWYPEGPDKGVAKCRHAKLAVSSEPQGSTLNI